ncbi:hypothetical protein [Gluconobacter japonicus]|uniref:hypothetical protein n=1 Tax=Gluconobacter japonicus TaxID=376620 RepID=UPI0039EA63BA
MLSATRSRAVSQASALHFLPCGVGQEVLVLGPLGDVGEDIDLAKRRLVESDVIAAFVPPQSNLTVSPL